MCRWSSEFRVNGCRLDFAGNGAIKGSEIAGDERVREAFRDAL